VIDVTETGDARHRLSPLTRENSSGMNAQIRVFSVDDHPLVREGIAMMINVQPGMRMVAQASTGREAIERFREHKPDVTLMDLRLPDMSGIDAMIAIRAEFPEARIIILTTFDSDTESRKALAEGARAYMLKSAPPKDLAETIRLIHAG
jgi:DNA-binding NarL/FixJ family response regulator